MEVERKPEHRLAVAPGRGAERVAGGHEQRLADRADPARRPDAATPCAGCPADDGLRILEGNPDDPAMVIAAIAVMPAEWHVDHAIDDGQRAALILAGG